MAKLLRNSPNGVSHGNSPSPPWCPHCPPASTGPTQPPQLSPRQQGISDRPRAVQGHTEPPTAASHRPIASWPCLLTVPTQQAMTPSHMPAPRGAGRRYNIVTASRWLPLGSAVQLAQSVFPQLSRGGDRSLYLPLQPAVSCVWLRLSSLQLLWHLQLWTSSDAKCCC